MALLLILCASNTRASELAVYPAPVTAVELEDPVSPPQEHIDRVEKTKTVVPLDENLFGDSINYYTGTVEFSVTDVSIPGNSNLPVAISRRLDVSTTRSRGAQGRSPHVFEEWDLDIPHLHGVFAASTGWQAGPIANVRCNQSDPNLAKPPQMGSIEADDYWLGNMLYVPGSGDDEIMHLPGSAPNRPTDGQTYRWVTKGLWYFSCLPTTANGVAGDAFLARDPKGNKYWFNQFVEKLYAPVLRGSQTLQQLARRETFILPTRVEDRFGNWVTYSYSAANPRNLTRIEANDGRYLDIVYNTQTGPSSRITSVTDGVRTWTYLYGGSSVGTLTSVVLPDQSSYTYNSSALFDDHVDSTAPTCGGSAPFVYSFEKTLSMTHPSGATGEFRFKFIRNGRTYVPQNCWTADSQSGDRHPLNFVALGLVRKRIVGGLIPSPLEWTWTYPAATYSYDFQCSPSCPISKLITILQPDGSQAELTFGIRYGSNDGLLLSERLTSAGSPLRTTDIDYQIDTAGQNFLATVGTPIRSYGDPSTGKFKPKKSQVISQQGATFSWQVTQSSGVYSFDQFARPLNTLASSSLGYSRSEGKTYQDFPGVWVLSQPGTSTVNGTVVDESTYYSSTGLPFQEFRFGELVRTYSHFTDGLLQSITDGRMKTTSYSQWKRGIPQTVTYADSSSKTAVVDDLGWIASTTNEAGYTTSYNYDSMGRASLIVYPLDSSSTWANTVRNFSRSLGAEFGLPVGTWKQTIETGNSRKHIWYDQLWRPILEREWDNGSPSATQRFVRRDWSSSNHEIFTSYPLNSISVRGDLVLGVSKQFDPIDRIVLESVDTDGELVADATTSYSYGNNFETLVTDPRGFQTRYRYQAFSVPSLDAPSEVFFGENGPLAERVTATLVRDAFGKVTSITRTGNGANATRSMTYDAQQRLCQLTEPESGALVIAYDAAGNLDWSADGRTPAGNCSSARNGVPVQERTIRSYTDRNWLSAVNYPELAGFVSPDTATTYTPDGLVKTAVNANSQWTYDYNSRRQIKSETLVFEGISYGLAWAYDSVGHLGSLTYPAGFVSTFTPNALGQATQNSGLVSGISYHANGAAAGWTYGNGVVRSITQTTRRLQDRIRDVGLGLVLDEDYGYDAGLNLSTVIDGRDVSMNRTMTYDAQDRLKSALGAWGAGNFTYDGADNLKSLVLGGKSYTYAYSSEKLLNVTPSGFPPISYSHDARGNITAKGGITFVWDYANRLVRTNGVSQYLYDAHGHRLMIEKLNPNNQATGDRVFQLYSKNGYLLYEFASLATPPETPLFSNGFENQSTSSNSEVRGLTGADSEAGATSLVPVDSMAQSAGVARYTTYHYVGKQLVARRDAEASGVGLPPNGTAFATFFLHTDTLGSVVAESDGSQNVVRRAHYEPFGMPVSAVASGPSFAGHVLDSNTELVYMRARYFDPDTGRFLSKDLSVPSSFDAEDFNQYCYARNNPYKYVDPDGKFIFLAPLLTLGGTLTAGEAALVWLGLGAIGGTVILESQQQQDQIASSHLTPSYAPLVTRDVEASWVFSKPSDDVDDDTDDSEDEDGDEFDGKQRGRRGNDNNPRHEDGAEPASEKAARDIGDRIKKDLGADAARDFHDAKVGQDRSLAQLKDDARALYEEAGEEVPKWLR
ncbi:RHS repeat domain-containing protein [Ahniella affigens]|uniref:RHS repeat domain-containing protein n=1 Tax=Ahniella affigens TaxID=2021234 RepID=UPI001475730B|nr:RHS repeat-associated core domain-containing protein [Ahniella affigens]